MVSKLMDGWMDVDIQPSIHPFIHCSMGSAPVGDQCPLTFSLGEFLDYWASFVIICYRPFWCPSPSTSWCFSIHSSSPAIGFHSCFFFKTDVSAPIRLSLYLLTF